MIKVEKLKAGDILLNSEEKSVYEVTRVTPKKQYITVQNENDRQEVFRIRVSDLSKKLVHLEKAPISCTSRCLNCYGSDNIIKCFRLPYCAGKIFKEVK